MVRLGDSGWPRMATGREGRRAEKAEQLATWANPPFVLPVLLLWGLAVGGTYRRCAVVSRGASDKEDQQLCLHHRFGGTGLGRCAGRMCLSARAHHR